MCFDFQLMREEQWQHMWCHPPLRYVHKTALWHCNYFPVIKNIPQTQGRRAHLPYKSWIFNSILASGAFRISRGGRNLCMGNLSLLATALLFSQGRDWEAVYGSSGVCALQSDCNSFLWRHQNPHVDLDPVISVWSSVSEVTDWGEWEQSLHEVLSQNFCSNRMTKSDCMNFF